MNPNGTYFRLQCGRGESQKDSDPKPKVARNELPWEAWANTDNPNGVAARWWKRDATPLGLKTILRRTQGSSCLATWARGHNPFGIAEPLIIPVLGLTLPRRWNFRKTLFSALPLVALALVGGCAVGPDYKRPEATTIPASYTGATASYPGATNGWKVAEPQGQLPKGNWWEIFGDAELNELENQADAANQQLKAAFARFTEARAVMDATRSRLFPDLSISASYTRQRSSAKYSVTHDRQCLRQQQHVQ